MGLGEKVPCQGQEHTQNRADDYRPARGLRQHVNALREEVGNGFPHVGGRGIECFQGLFIRHHRKPGRDNCNRPKENTEELSQELFSGVRAQDIAAF